jgi:hypothetical protein
MWQLKNRCLKSDNTLEMPIHNVIVNDQFKPILILISKFEHSTLTQPLIVIYELDILLAHESFHLGHPHFVLPEQEGRNPVMTNFGIHPAACL